MTWETYHEVEADNYFDLGLELGKCFAKPIYCAAREMWRNHNLADCWYENIFQRAIERTKECLPNVWDELNGYAEGAELDLRDMWWLAMGDDLGHIYDNHSDMYSSHSDPKRSGHGNHCTTVITNNGLLIGHNEDYSAEISDELFVVKKTVRDLTILELYYAGSLGGNSISINSHGFVHTVNSLPHSRYREGFPRDLIARWLSETSDPEADHKQMEVMTREWGRMSGYSHNIVSPRGHVYNIESCAEKSRLWKRQTPYCHTNHFLDDIKECPTDDDVADSRDRYGKACELLCEDMNVEYMKELLSNTVGEGEGAIFNKSTIGRMIVDLEEPKVHIWLLRDDRPEWTTYDIDLVG